MSRLLTPLLMGLLVLAFTAPISAADGPAGTWKTSFSVPTRQGEVTLNMLFMFSESEGKWVADFLDIAPPGKQRRVKHQHHLHQSQPSMQQRLLHAKTPLLAACRDTVA